MTALEQSAVTIRPLRDADWPAVQRICEEGIATGHATFEPVAPDWELFNTSRLPRHRLVAENADGRMLGWAAASPISARPAYSGVVEHSVYGKRASARCPSSSAKLFCRKSNFP